MQIKITGPLRRMASCSTHPIAKLQVEAVRTSMEHPIDTVRVKIYATKPDLLFTDEQVELVFDKNTIKHSANLSRDVDALIDALIRMRKEAI